MNGLLLLLGRTAGIGGLLLCVVAAVVRLQGSFYMGAFQLATLLQAGIGAIVVGCFFLLWALTASSKTASAVRSPD